MKTEIRQCEKCEESFEATLIPCYGKFIGKNFCDKCSTRSIEEMAQESKDLALSNWKINCPTTYLKTDVSKLPQEQYEKAMKWEFGSKGIGLIGETGKGKTRIAWQVLKNVCALEYEEITATEFSHECSFLFSSDLEKAKQWIEYLCNVKILFIDDVGKERVTERISSELFYIVEKRTAWERPIIWTSNFSGKNLEEKLGESGAATVRRLREFSDIVVF